MSSLPESRSAVIVGTYVDEAGSSLYLCEFDHLSGELTIRQQLSGINRPSFLDIDPVNSIAYCINVSKDAEGNNGTGIEAYQINSNPLLLSRLNKRTSLPATSCHIALDRVNRNLLVSSYHGGMLGLVAIGPDGRVGETREIYRNSGSSVHPAQTQSRMHSVTIDPSNRFAIAADLGTDQILIYELHAEQHLKLRHKVPAAPGAGPRHAVFHSTLPVFYMINELNSTITVYQFDAESGALTEIETRDTLPAEYSGDNACADIHISPDGRFLYGSNRGHDSIVSFEINPADGTLQLLAHTSTMGEHPRNFAISPDGQYLLAANKNSHSVVIFKRDPASGTLQATGRTLEVAEPVCIKFVQVN